jgi:DNA-binding transcriptional LysR family regulator
MHEFLKTSPFDLYELYLFHLVAQHRSFTKAAEVAGLTQSAITRQVQGMERRLDLALLERTTRHVRVTPAGAFLEQEALRHIGGVEHSLRRLREDFADARKVVRVGVSPSVGLAFLPGFFYANVRREPRVGYRVRYESSASLLSLLETGELDLAVLCPPRRIPRTLTITHRFEDTFTLIASAEIAGECARRSRPKAAEWLRTQNWLVLDPRSNTGARLGAWMKRQGWTAEPTMQLASFDLIINLVALGMGVSFVPIRALALYPAKRNIRRIALPDRFSRELVVAMRRQRVAPPHVERFVRNVLF